MPEPHSTAATAAGLALGAVTISGTILGMHYDALLFGFAAALIALMHLPPKDDKPRTPVNVFSLVVGASFFAGVLAPPVALTLSHYFPWVELLGADALRIAAAALIGAGVHVAIPLFFGWMTRKSEGGA